MKKKEVDLLEIILHCLYIERESKDSEEKSSKQ